jgi:type I restriction enzyme, R subunit
MTATAPVQIEDHRGFHELLISGVPISYVDDEGVERHDRVWLVDFEDPPRNELLAVNQFTIVAGGNNRRPDILLFVNGLPLGQVELKAPGVAKSAREAVNQVHHYTDSIPGLYRYVEIVGVSDLMTARVGTSSTPAEHFAEWKAMAGAGENAGGRTQLQTMLEGVFAPPRFPTGPIANRARRRSVARSGVCCANTNTGPRTTTTPPAAASTRAT